MNILSRMMGGIRPSFQSDIPITDDFATGAASASLNGPLVAVIGRDARIVKPLCRQLAASGCAVIVFSDPDAYLEYLLAAPRVHLSSVFMVQELYGYASLLPHELAEHSKTLCPQARVSVVSDMHTQDNISAGTGAGVDCLLKAPTNALAVVSAIGMNLTHA